jgi:hypothetical protein
MKALDGAVHAHDSPEAARQTTRHRIPSAPVLSAENGGSAGIGCRGTQARAPRLARWCGEQRRLGSCLTNRHEHRQIRRGAPCRASTRTRPARRRRGRRAGSRGSGWPEVRPPHARASYAQCWRGYASCQLPPLRSGTASPPAWRPSTSTSSLPIIRSVWTLARLTPMPRSSSSERPSGSSSKAPRMEAP